MKWCTISRRHFLQGLGKASLALPLLPSLLSREVRAQVGGAPKRLVLMRSINGSVSMNNYLPIESGLTNYVVPGINYGGENHTMRHGSLSTQAASNGGQVSPTIPSALTPMLSKMFFWHGFDMPRTYGHFTGQTFGNMGGYGNTNPSDVKKTPTIDEVVAYATSFYADSTTMAKRCAVALPNSYGGSGTVPSYGYSNPLVRSGDIVQRPHYHRADILFSAIFGDNIPDDSGPNLTLVDAIYEDYVAVRNHPRLGMQDRQSMEAHLTFMQELQNNLAMNGPACSDVEAPAQLDTINKLDEMGQKQTYALYNDVIAAAIRCDKCRVFNMPIIWADGKRNGSANQPGGWHYWSHNAGDFQAELIDLNAWANEYIFLDLINKLDAIEETPGTTFLDNSLVLRTDEHSFSTHCDTNMYFLGAGSAGGFFANDKYIDFRDQNATAAQYIRGNKPGFLYNQLLANILLAMGISPTEFESYNLAGQKGYGDHSFASDSNGIAREARYTTHMNKLSEILPLVQG